MKHLTFIAMIALGVWFSACNKEEQILPPGQAGSEMITTATPPVYLDDSTSKDEPVVGYPKSGSILNAATANDIQSQYFYSSSSYKNKYLHLKQYVGESSWTSYVVCAGAIVNGDAGSYVYGVNYTKVSAVKTWCAFIPFIEYLRDYANQVDYGYFGHVYLSKEYKNSTGRFNTVKQMLNNLDVYHKPFLAIITRNGIGHYVVVWNIDWKCGGTGSTVYYTDPLDYPTGNFYSQLRSMDMTSFLDKMGPYNLFVSKYCALFLRGIQKVCGSSPHLFFQKNGKSNAFKLPHPKYLSPFEDCIKIGHIARNTYN